MIAKQNRKMSILLITIMLFGLLASFSFESNAAKITLDASAKIKPSDGAILRKSASKKSKRIRVLKKNTKIVIKKEVFVTKNKTSSSNKWYYVTCGKYKGYVRSDLVKDIKMRTAYGTATDNLYYRIGAGKGMTRKGMFKKGAVFKVVMIANPKGSTKKWYKVISGKSYYYACGDWIKLSATKPVAKVTVKTTTPRTTVTPAPNVVQSASSRKVAEKASNWAVKIANDNSFHYGNGSAAHHNGCYFCGTQVLTGGRSKKGVVNYEKTYCCNPFVHAAFAHGGNDPEMLRICKKGSSYIEKHYILSDRFANLGKPDRSMLLKGDVLCCYNGHVMMYIGNGQIVEAANGDDGIIGSAKWNDSITIRSLPDARYNNKSYGVCGVYRYIAK